MFVDVCMGIGESIGQPLRNERCPNKQCPLVAALLVVEVQERNTHFPSSLENVVSSLWSLLDHLLASANRCAASSLSDFFLANRITRAETRRCYVDAGIVAHPVLTLAIPFSC